MQKRKTIALDHEKYEKPVRQSIEKSDDAKHISTVINQRFKEKRSDYFKLLEMSRMKKSHKVNEKEMEDFRSELSQRLER